MRFLPNSWGGGGYIGVVKFFWGRVNLFWVLLHFH